MTFLLVMSVLNVALQILVARKASPGDRTPAVISGVLWTLITIWCINDLR